MADLMKFLNGVLFWDLNFVRESKLGIGVLLQFHG